MKAIFDRAQIDAMERRMRANLINCLAGYKSANLIGTVDSAGHTNLALMSSVFHVGANPPLMGLLLRPHTVPRHSLENIIEQGCFTLNAVDRLLYRQAHQTTARYPRELSEFDAVGLTPVFSEKLTAPYVAQSPIQIGLTLVDRQTMAVNDTVLVIGEIIEIRLAEHLLAADGQVDLHEAGLVCVSGLDEYHVAESLGRQAYPKP